MLLSLNRSYTMAETTTFLPSLSSDFQTENSTECKPHQHTPGIAGIIYITNQFVCLFGLVGNGIVLWFLRSYIRKNPIIIYILSLALADFAYLLCCLFIIIIFSIEYIGSYYFPWCMPMSILFKVELFLYSTSMYFLTVISIERCLCVLCPFWYHSRRPEWASSAVSAGLWSLAVLPSGVNICSLWEKAVCQELDKAINAVNLLLCTPIMVLSSLTLFTKMRYCSPQHQPGYLHTTILLTVFFFVIFAVPLSIEHLLRDYYILPNVFYLLASVNSSINPVIYFLVGCHREKWFREPLEFILHRALNEEKDTKEKEEVQGQI